MFKTSYNPDSNTLTITSAKLLVWIDHIPADLRSEAEFYDRSMFSESTAQNIIFEFSERGAVITQVSQDKPKP